MPDIFDFITDLAQKHASLFIAACALFLTINQSMATRKHNRLSIKPHLTSFVSRMNGPEQMGVRRISATLSNNGLGPAFIKSYELLLDGKSIDATEPKDVYPVVARVIPAQLIQEDCYFTFLRDGYVMAKGDEVAVAVIAIALTIHDDPVAIEEALNRFHIRVVFESAYGESTIYDSRDHRKSHPLPLTCLQV